MVGVNYQGGTLSVPSTIQRFYIVDAESAIPEANNIYAYRLMDWHDYMRLPLNAICCLWNEDDDGADRTWRLHALLFVKSARPDLKVYYGAERPNVPPDPEVLKYCDGLMVHVAQGQPIPPNVIVTEYEFDPNNPNRWTTLASDFNSLNDSGTPVFLFTWQWRNPPAEYSTNLDICAQPQIVQLLLNQNQKEIKMGLSIGSGVQQWISDHQATPLSNENYLSPDFAQSVTAVKLADANGKPVEGFVVYDKTSGSLTYFEQA